MIIKTDPPRNGDHFTADPFFLMVSAADIDNYTVKYI